MHKAIARYKTTNSFLYLTGGINSLQNFILNILLIKWFQLISIQSMLVSKSSKEQVRIIIIFETEY
jgi:hypothetical protein